MKDKTIKETAKPIEEMDKVELVDETLLKLVSGGTNTCNDSTGTDTCFDGCCYHPC